LTAVNARRPRRRNNPRTRIQSTHENPRVPGEGDPAQVRRCHAARRHLGAIVSGGKGTAQEKLAVVEECGIKVTKNPAEMGKLLKSGLK
jgi:hypothetical protein